MLQHGMKQKNISDIECASDNERENDKTNDCNVDNADDIKINNLADMSVLCSGFENTIVNRKLNKMDDFELEENYENKSKDKGECKLENDKNESEIRLYFGTLKWDIFHLNICKCYKRNFRMLKS